MADAKTNQLEYALSLPELRGSEKQVKWARDIRAREIKRLWEYYPEISVARLHQAVTLVTQEGRILRATDAHWWIENRKRRIWAKIAEAFGVEMNPLGFQPYRKKSS